MHFNEIHVGLRVKSDAIALCAPFGLLLENEALSNRKAHQMIFSRKLSSHMQTSYNTKPSDLVALFGQRKLI